MRGTLVAAFGIALGADTMARADSYVITLDPSAVRMRAEPVSGRLILFFITKRDGRLSRTDPIQGPFWNPPQPIASVEVRNLQPGGSVTIRQPEGSFPDSLETLDGPVRVQALLDRDMTVSSHAAGPGNLYSDVAGVELSARADETVRLVLSNRVEPQTPPEEAPNVRWVEFRSPRLSEFYGRDVYHLAGVALPPRYLDPGPAGAARRRWPAVYVVPAFGRRHYGAALYAKLLKERAEEMPEAVYIVLDPDSPLGHHGFVDSPNHGPRGEALIKELIPHLQSTFRLETKAQGRLVTGHSSGGWSALWLQLNWPEVFGGCWSSAPDPIDFSAFQMANLYEESNLYTNAAGKPVPSYRGRDRPGEPLTLRMTVRQEGLMEYAMHPAGGSGQQWDTWEAMFSPPDPRTGYPRQMFDPRSGQIDRAVIEHWKRFDITRMVTSDWETYGGIVTQKVRLACGTDDSFYLQRAVERFKATVEKLAGDVDGPGYVWLVEGATHGSIHRSLRDRWPREMIEHLRRHGLHE